MNIIVVDDERASLWMLEKIISDLDKSDDLSCFESALEALEYASNHTVDVAFLDIVMAEIDGITMAKRLKEIHPKVNIIFVTGQSNYMENAFDLHASGYVLKPVDAKRIAKELDNLRHPVAQVYQGLRIQCFGNFDVFMDGKPLIFRRSKSKEALAYLVDRRGSSVSKKELASILWEDQPYTHSMQSHLYLVISEMIRVLREVDSDDIIIRKRGLYSLDITKVTCDYYEYEKGVASAINQYRGEYMSNYSWAEYTAGILAYRQ